MKRLQNSAEALAAIRRLTPKQREVLGFIAVGEDSGHHPATLAVLERKRLIKGYRERLPGGAGDPAWLAAIVRRYVVPLLVRVAWRAWCADNVPDEPPT